MTAPVREARIDLAAVRGNIRALRELVAPAQVLAVVKAEGYGHGAELVARAALEAGADWLGAADIDEALALRAAGIEAPLLAWLHGPEIDLSAALAAEIDLGVSSLTQLEQVAEHGRGRVHLKIDTGLSRNGCAPEDWIALVTRAADLEAAGRLEVRGIFSHLSNTDQAEDALQRARFTAAVDMATAAGLRPELRHLAASQAAITTPEARFDLVRLGISIYGLAADPSIDAAALGLRPAMELAGRVAAVRRVPAGAGGSYGYTYRAPAPTTLALVPLGYADGVPRSASNRGAEVAISGVRHPIVGRIAMDQFLVDVGDAPVRVGDRAVLWGDPATGVPSADEWAEWADTINYEIVTRVGPRVTRTPVDGEPDV